MNIRQVQAGTDWHTAPWDNSFNVKIASDTQQKTAQLTALNNLYDRMDADLAQQNEHKYNNMQQLEQFYMSETQAAPPPVTTEPLETQIASMEEESWAEEAAMQYQSYF